MTNTVALCPCYFGVTLAQLKDLRGQEKRLWLIVPASIVGGVVGGYLLLQTGEKLFKDLVPYLILLASGLLAIQDLVRAWLVRRMGEHHGARLEKLTWLPVSLASVYGGYFGAGIGILMLAALSLLGLTDIHQMNGLKTLFALCINVVATIYFMTAGLVELPVAATMALGAVSGGYGGAGLARKLGPLVVRRAVVAIVFAMTISLFVKQY